ncbi:N-acetylmuramoyl-L-alanine amidase [Saccharopolyspora rosea]
MVAATATGLLTAAPPAIGAAPQDNGATTEQRAFDSAAKEYGIPEPLLMAVSFQLTRWEDHHGEQSKAGGYGPMHLTDVDPQELLNENAKLTKPVDNPSLHTLNEAAKLIDADPDEVKRDVTLNIRAGAALLADRAKAIGDDHLPNTIGGWYPAVAELSGSPRVSGGRSFAEDVYDVLGQGRKRTTSTGQTLAFPKIPQVVPDKNLSRTRLEGAQDAPKPTPKAECPSDLDCRYIPAAYAPVDPKQPDAGYGNYDTGNRPGDGNKIRYIVIHDTETSYQSTIASFQNPAHGAASHYVVRSSDGQVTQMVPTKDIPWHAGNWDANMHAIGIEHEGWAAEGGTWYTERMYKASADLVRYLANKYDIPLDRAHILGHEDVSADKPSKVGSEHYDPGPYWDWAHYMKLLQSPLDSDKADDDAQAVTIFPNFAKNRPEVSQCSDKGCENLPAQPANFVYLRTEPRDDAPLITSPVIHKDGSPGTTRIEDWSDKAVAGRQYAVAGRSGDWLAIWYEGKKAWLRDPDGNNTAAADDAKLVTPRRGGIPTFGMAVPNPSEYPKGIDPTKLEPLPYTIPANQRYVAGDAVQAMDYHAVYDGTNDPNNHKLVRGSEKYVPISLNHRWVYVKQSDIQPVS